MICLIAKLGEYSISVLKHTADFLSFTLSTLVNMPFVKLRRLFECVVRIGYTPIIIIAPISTFAGIVLTIQSKIALGVSESIAAELVSLAIVREIGPVVTGLVISGAVGSAITADIATMQITDQIRALRTMSINPIRYVISPWILAGCIAMPLMVIFADTMGMFGVYLTLSNSKVIPPLSYWEHVTTFVNMGELAISVLKGLVFGWVITTIATRKGYSAIESVESIGNATTSGVSINAIFILIIDCIFVLFG